ncbi:MAG: outer membrane protein assembly factor BamE [Paludibacterium sp.]|uniref:outer membrane protein assembly factor BamE n=1 Tax=Paludibacterium sp. TaxID=1917523 RepID=UPI0025EE147C|nr:outer membrane protein assembly factor BamE [Paludibacterium sp.]MBV8049197.1 outer membrane protein assembly factor BamE [Paludibacterium sp.]MBV8647262.1 outer membrane protein assembly factor BamE [Paludibacterium sp.]
MRALTLVAVIALSGCTYLNPANWHPYHMDIQQGNLVTQDDVARLKVGMTRSQVRFVLGTPLIVDSFHANRWDYKYQLFQNGKKVADKHLTVTFNGDVLSQIDGDAMPPEVPAARLDTSAPAASAPAAATRP